MMSTEEAQALAQILSRTPVSQAEALWLNSLIARLTTVAPLQPIEQREQKKNGQQPEQTIIHERSIAP